MTSKQRVDAVLAGRMPDRLPVSFWYHFRPDQIAGPGAVHAHIAQLERPGRLCGMWRRGSSRLCAAVSIISVRWRAGHHSRYEQRCSMP